MCLDEQNNRREDLGAVDAQAPVMVVVFEDDL
jgi:hypothetical protein